MVSTGAISTCLIAAGFGPVSAGHSPQDLASQLAKYQAELADWEHCASRTTDEGRATIAQLQAKVAEIESQQRKQQQASATGTPAVQGASVSPQSSSGSTIDIYV